jgi:hypothetical protein
MNLGSSSRTLGIDAPESTVIPAPSSATAATISAKSPKRQQSGRAYTVTLASLCGGGVPSGDKSKKPAPRCREYYHYSQMDGQIAFATGK